MGKLLFYWAIRLTSYFLLLGRVLGELRSEPCPVSRQHRCEVRLQDRIFCYGLPPSNITSAERTKVLSLCHVRGPGFDPRIISSFPQLHRLTVVNSSVTHFKFHFPYHKNLQLLNLSYLQLEFLHRDTFVKLRDLKVIDLSYNRFKRLGASVFDRLLNLQQLHLKGEAWNCSSDLTWLVGKLSRFLVNPSEMVCGQMKYFGKPVIPIMTFAKSLESECPKMTNGRCRCKLDNVVWSQDEDYLIPVTTVNCSHLGIENLPSDLPSNTTILLLTHNNISDLSPLVTENSYRHVADIYLDHNRVETVDRLEGAVWLSNFRVFSLRANKIRLLPTYAFDNAFEKNKNAAKVFFGSNPWTCDCIFTPMFKELIAKHHTLIQDIEDIKCAQDGEEENAMKIIRDLSPGSVCQEHKNLWLSPLDFVNLLLSFLILITIGKFIYDYWIYSKTGKLPWIAMRLL